MRCRLITPLEEKELEARSVNFRSAQGWLTILDHHAPILAIIKEGRIIIQDGARQETTLKIKGGFLEVKDDQVIITTDKLPLADAE